MKSCDYAMFCPRTMPVIGSKCTCGTGHSVHSPGEGNPCAYGCNGQFAAGSDVVVRCNRAATDLWELVGDSEPACAPGKDGG